MSISISVVTCTWNSGAYLPAAISSVLSQLHSNYEVIFVDGGSTDSTLEQVEAVTAPKKVLHNVRGGIARAMNAGLAAATGDIVMHLHSDDYLLHPQVFSRVVNAFEREGCDWLFGRILNDRDGGIFPETYIAPVYSYRNLLKANFVPHAATFVRRSLFARGGGFDESLKFAMDYEMWLRLGRLATPIQLREALSVFRRHEGSTTEKNRLGSFDEDYAVRKRYIGADPRLQAEHRLRYWVRRRRLLNQLKPQN